MPRPRTKPVAAAPRRPRLVPSPAAANGAPANGTVQLGVLPGLLGYQLRLAQRAMFDDFADTMGELEVSPGLFGMLVVIEANPGLKQTELAHAAQLDRSSLVPALDKLEARGLVARRASQEDRRVNGLWLTPDGAALLKKLKQRVARHELRLARDLTAEERDMLVALLHRILPERR
jgi:DNA-binding MarR family transcriptional regulator